MVPYGAVGCHPYGVPNMCAAYRKPWNFSAITLIKVFDNTTSKSPKMQPTDGCNKSPSQSSGRQTRYMHLTRYMYLNPYVHLNQYVHLNSCHLPKTCHTFNLLRNLQNNTKYQLRPMSASNIERRGQRNVCGGGNKKKGVMRRK